MNYTIHSRKTGGARPPARPSPGLGNGPARGRPRVGLPPLPKRRLFVRLFWKLFCSMVLITALACSAGGYALIGAQFNASLGREVEACLLYTSDAADER